MDTHRWLVSKFGDEVAPLSAVAKQLLGKDERQFIRTNEKAGGPPWPYFQVAKGTPRMCRLRDVAAALDARADEAKRELEAIR